MTKKQAGVIAVIAVPAAAVVLTAVVFSLYLFFGGFDDAAEASLDDADLIVKLADVPDAENAFLTFMSATNHYSVAENWRIDLTDDRFLDYGVAFTNGRPIPGLRRCFHQWQCLCGEGKKSDKRVGARGRDTGIKRDVLCDDVEGRAAEVLSQCQSARAAVRDVFDAANS